MLYTEINVTGLTGQCKLNGLGARRHKAIAGMVIRGIICTTVIDL